jgi:hypothetical protein
VIAVGVADVACPARQGLGKDGRTALTAAGGGPDPVRDLVVWLKPVAVAPAVVRRDGRVQAAGHPADHARLGVAEQRLDELCGVPGVIDQVARSVALDGRVKGAARRAMSPALAIRFTLLMTLVPDADYTAVIETLLGDLVLMPWQRPYRVPTAAVACTWREALGPAPLERLRDMELAGIDGGHRAHDYRAVTVGDLEVGSIGGSRSASRTPRPTGRRSGRRAPPMTHPRIRSCGSCGSPPRPPAPPSAWPPGRPAPAQAGTRGRTNRCCWTRR